MNANEISPTNNARLNRIQKVSRALRTAFFTFTVLVTIAAVMCSGALVISIIQWGGLGPLFRASLATGSNVAYAMGTWFCFRLFNLYSQGDLFSHKIVQNIRRIACMYFVAML